LKIALIAAKVRFASASGAVVAARLWDVSATLTGVSFDRVAVAA
jgi:hypothetical protein